MSAFKRRVPQSTVTNGGISSSLTPMHVPKLIGTQYNLTGSPIPLVSSLITSSGIPSLDDILGGGLPLSCLMLVLAPDAHSAYAELTSKYFVAQGLAVGQCVCVVAPNGAEWTKECMWTPTASSAGHLSTTEKDAHENDEDVKVKIAWRYENMGKFQTTVSNDANNEGFCKTFDLTVRIPENEIEEATRSGKLMFIGVDDALRQIGEVVKGRCVSSGGSSTSTALPLRICVPMLGSPEWGDMTTQDVLRFIHGLRSLLRTHSTANACAAISLAPHLCHNAINSPWTQKLGWMSDACIEMRAFGADPSLTTLFPAHHGMLTIHSLPAPHSLLPPSDKFSTLRAIHASGGTINSNAVSSASPSVASSAEGGGENNLAFKCMRKRLVFETLHLDVEGGVGERRTTPAKNASVLEDVATTLQHQQHQHHQHHLQQMKPAVESKVDVELEGVTSSMTPGPEKPVKKKKKAVVFQSDRPELYDF